ncbi:hypothetical protein QEN19_002211 [Hanseniaspora menglaensis]
MLTRICLDKYRILSHHRSRLLCFKYKDGSFSDYSTLVNNITKRCNSNKIEISKVVIGDSILNQTLKETGTTHVNITELNKQAVNLTERRIKKISFQDRKMIVKEIETIAFNSKDRKTERIKELRHYKDILLKTYELTALNIALSIEFDNKSFEKYNSLKLINGGFLIYIAYFPEMLFWRKLFQLANSIENKNYPESITSITKIYLQDLGLSFSLKEAQLFSTYMNRTMSNEDFITFFQYCITNDLKTLKMNNTIYYVNRILRNEDQTECAIISKSILIFKGAENEFREMELHKKLRKLLPDKYFFSVVEYMSANNVNNELSQMLQYMNGAIFDLFQTKYQHKKKVKLLDATNYLRCFYLGSLKKNMILTDDQHIALTPIEYFTQTIKHIQQSESNYSYDELEIFFIRNFEMLTEMLNHYNKLEYFQTPVMHVLSKYSMLVMGNKNTSNSGSSLVLHYRKKFWRIFFKNFLKLTDNDYGALFKFLEMLHPSIMVTLIKFDLLEAFNYKPSESFLRKIENHVANSTEEEIATWNVDQGSLADEAFLSDFYQFLVIPTSMDSQTFRTKYYEYCEKRDQIFKNPDNDLVTDVFVKLSTQKFNSYWIAFFILRTHLMKPIENRNMGFNNPILKFIRNDGFINASNTIEVKNKLFERYTNNFVRVYKAYGVPLDGYITMEFMLKAYRLGLARQVKKWYMFTYKRFKSMINTETWSNLLNLQLFKFICDNELPVIQQNERLVEFSEYYAEHKNGINHSTYGKQALISQSDKAITKEKDTITIENKFNNTILSTTSKDDWKVTNEKVIEDLNKIDFGFFTAEDYAATEKDFIDLNEVSLDEFLESSSEKQQPEDLEIQSYSSADDNIISCLKFFEKMVSKSFKI